MPESAAARLEKSLLSWWPGKVDGKLNRCCCGAFHPPEGVPRPDRNFCFTQSRFSSDVCTLVTLRKGHCRYAWGVASRCTLRAFMEIRVSRQEPIRPC